MYQPGQLVLTMLKNGPLFHHDLKDVKTKSSHHLLTIWLGGGWLLSLSSIQFLIPTLVVCISPTCLFSSGMGNLTSISPALASRHSISINFIRHKSGCVCPGIATNNKQSLWNFTSFWNHTSLWAESDERLSFGRHLFLLFPYFDHNLMVQNKDLL